MRVLIVGAGIAGLTLAFWLRRGGHRLTVIERSSSLRDEGYMIDFFGSGYDVSEKMGLLPGLATIHYPISRLACVDAQGREKFAVSYAAMRRLFNGRHFNFMHGDLVRLLYARVKDHVKLRFATTIVSFRQETERVQVVFSDGTSGLFDVLVGADGVHSHIRRLAFGAEACFARFLGYYTAAFMLGHAPPRSRHVAGDDSQPPQAGRVC